MNWNYEQRRVMWIGRCASLVLIIGGGAAYGHFSQRWGPPGDLLAAADHLITLPSTLGDWRLQKEDPMSEDVLRMLQCAGYVNRKYVHRATGDAVYLAVIVGPPGPTAVHTPEICYSSRNYEIVSQRERVHISASTDRHTFWNTDFRSKNALAQRMSVFFAWSDGGQWTASASPRYEFAASPKLFKLQLAAHIDPQVSAENSGAADFLRALLRSSWSLTSDDR